MQAEYVQFTELINMWFGLVVLQWLTCQCLHWNCCNILQTFFAKLFSCYLQFVQVSSFSNLSWLVSLAGGNFDVWHISCFVFVLTISSFTVSFTSGSWEWLHCGVHYFLQPSSVNVSCSSIFSGWTCTLISYDNSLKVSCTNIQMSWKDGSIGGLYWILKWVLSATSWYVHVLMPHELMCNVSSMLCLYLTPCCQCPAEWFRSQVSGERIHSPCCCCGFS